MIVNMCLFTIDYICYYVLTRVEHMMSPYDWSKLLYANAVKSRDVLYDKKTV
jgi:hypothetical protein